jgi:hypothetical protein
MTDSILGAVCYVQRITALRWSLTRQTTLQGELQGQVPAGQGPSCVQCRPASAGLILCHRLGHQRWTLVLGLQAL